MALVDRPRLTAIEHSGEHYRLVDLDLCLHGNASSVRHILVESAEGKTCLGKSGVDLDVHYNCWGKCFVKIRELIECVESFDGDVGFNVVLSWNELVLHLTLFDAWSHEAHPCCFHILVIQHDGL